MKSYLDVIYKSNLFNNSPNSFNSLTDRREMSKIILKEESYNIIGAAMSVHRELGCGFLEAIYQEALEYELKLAKIQYIREKQLKIRYRNIELSKYYIADFICYSKIILELKALSELTTDHEAQLINYLKATNLPLGILINFGQSSLEYKRIPNKYLFNNSTNLTNSFNSSNSLTGDR